MSAKKETDTAAAAENTGAEQATGQYISETEMELAEKATKKKITGEAKMKVVISPDGNGVNWEGCVNGVWYRFPKGREVEIPKALYALIASSATVLAENDTIASAYSGAKTASKKSKK